MSSTVITSTNPPRRKIGRPVSVGTYENYPTGAVRPYIRVCAGPQRDKYVHELVMEAKLGRELSPGETVEHEDGDTLNNDWRNLTVLTKPQNSAAMWERRNGEKERSEQSE